MSACLSVCLCLHLRCVCMHVLERSVLFSSLNFNTIPSPFVKQLSSFTGALLPGPSTHTLRAGGGSGDKLISPDVHFLLTIIIACTSSHLQMQRWFPRRFLVSMCSRIITGSESLTPFPPSLPPLLSPFLSPYLSPSLLPSLPPNHPPTQGILGT